MRGFAAIGLYQPKFDVNVGSALRAAGCYNAAFVATCGKRYSRAGTDTVKAYRHLPLIQTADLHSVIPFDCIPVCVELTEDAVALPLYQHPERAFYIFGPEDGSVPGHVQAFCRDKIYIPMQGCSNLAATINVVLYDRMCKKGP